MSEQNDQLGPPQDREMARVESEAVARQPGGASDTVRPGAPSAHEQPEGAAGGDEGRPPSDQA
jgi:hypothetical protein